MELKLWKLELENKMQKMRDEVYGQLSEMFNLEELSEKELEHLEKHIEGIINNAQKLLKMQNKVIKDKDKLQKFSELFAKTLGKV